LKDFEDGFYENQSCRSQGTDPSASLATILEAQAKMQQEFANYRKRNAKEMNALREENTRLKKWVYTAKGKGVYESGNIEPKATIHETEKESEYNPT